MQCFEDATKLIFQTYAAEQMRRKANIAYLQSQQQELPNSTNLADSRDTYKLSSNKTIKSNNTLEQKSDCCNS